MVRGVDIKGRWKVENVVYFRYLICTHESLKVDNGVVEISTGGLENISKINTQEQLFGVQE